jgi:hypothetical protein
VSGHDDGNSFSGEPFDAGTQLRMGRGIQARKRLIEQQQHRPAHPGAREQYPTQLSVGQLAQLAQRKWQQCKFAHGPQRRSSIGGTGSIIQTDTGMTT